MKLRKVQQTPSGTFFICLPKDWARRNGLTRGSLVAITETVDGKLMIDAKYDVEPSPQRVVIRPTPLLDRMIVEKYLLGYDVIEIEADGVISTQDYERIRQAIRRLVGLEIVEEDRSRIVMQCLLEPSALSPEKILRREYSIVAGMHRDAVKALIESDTALAEHVIARDNEVNRLYFLLVRILRSVFQKPGLGDKLKLRPIDCLDYRLISSMVEEIGDQSVQIAKVAVKLGETRIPEDIAGLIFRLHQVAYDSHERALKAFLSHDTSTAEAVRAEQEKIASLFRDIEVAAHKQPIKLAPHIISVATSIHRIYDRSVDMADLVMPRLV